MNINKRESILISTLSLDKSNKISEKCKHKTHLENKLKLHLLRILIK